MSIISAVRDYLAGYAQLKTGAPVWVDYLGDVPTEYGIQSLPGNRILATYINGMTRREYAFAFRSMESTADNLNRLEKIGFFEAFADWLDSQTNAGILPNLGAGKTAEAIEATGWGYLYEQGQSETGVYQIQCRLIYEQV